MFEKFEILLIIFFLLFLFYIVIALGARRKNQLVEIKNYLKGVRFLILILSVVAVILVLFL